MTAMDKVTTRQDRIAGFVLLALAVAVMLVPDFRAAGQPIKTHLIAGSWFAAAILLLSMDSAARPMPRLIRWGAAILFVTGLLGPFVANLIDPSLGA